MNTNLKLNVGDFVLSHAQWCEVLAMGDPQFEQGRCEDITAVRIAFACRDRLNSDASMVSIQTCTHYEGGSMEKLVRTREDMLLAVAGCSSVYPCHPVTRFTCAGLLSARLVKLNYGSVQDYAAQSLHSERLYWDTSVKSWIFDTDVVRDIVNDRDFLKLILDVYRPFKSELKDGNITITRTAVDAKRDRQTSMKPGRAFRHMFPWLDDKALACITEAWVEHSAPRVLTLKTGKSALDFHRAYSHTRAEYRNPSTTRDRKSIASSCMQGINRNYYSDGEFMSASVGEAYASGDFSVAWLETEDGFIAGRVVYSDVDGTPHHHGPIYGACEQSLDELQSYLDGIDSGLDIEEWAGLRLAVVGDSDDPIVPYIDGYLRGSLSRCEKHILLSISGGDFEFDSTEGYITGGESCSDCGCSMAEDDTFFTDDGCMCETCFDSNYVVTEGGATLHTTDAIYVHTKTRWGSSEEWVREDEASYCEALDQYWHIDDVTYTEDGDDCIPTHLIGDFPELFPVDDDDEDELEEAA